MGDKNSKLRGHIEEMWPITKSLTSRSEPKAPSGINDPLGFIFYPIDKVNNCSLLKNPVHTAWVM
jgi:hypothetical protein